MKEFIKSELNSQKGYVVMLYKLTPIICIKYLIAHITNLVNNVTSIDIIINKIDFVSEQQRMIIQIDICEKEDNSKKARIRYISEDIDDGSEYYTFIFSTNKSNSKLSEKIITEFPMYASFISNLVGRSILELLEESINNMEVNHIWYMVTAE